jgi:hypothetical protein
MPPLGEILKAKNMKVKILTSVILFILLFGCQDDGTVHIPIKFTSPQPTSEEQTQKMMQQLAQEGCAGLTVVNSSKSTIEKIEYHYKYQRQNQYGAPLPSIFFDVVIPPGGTVLLKVPAGVYKKVTCLKNGKEVKIWEETGLQAGQLYSFPIK